MKKLLLLIAVSLIIISCEKELKEQINEPIKANIKHPIDSFVLIRCEIVTGSAIEYIITPDSIFTYDEKNNIRSKKMFFKFKDIKGIEKNNIKLSLFTKTFNSFINLKLYKDGEYDCYAGVETGYTNCEVGFGAEKPFYYTYIYN